MSDARGRGFFPMLLQIGCIFVPWLTGLGGDVISIRITAITIVVSYDSVYFGTMDCNGCAAINKIVCHCQQWWSHTASTGSQSKCHRQMVCQHHHQVKSSLWCNVQRQRWYHFGLYCLAETLLRQLCSPMCSSYDASGCQLVHTFKLKFDSYLKSTKSDL